MQATETPIQEFIATYRTALKTPYYLIDEARLLANLERITPCSVARTRVRWIACAQELFDLVCLQPSSAGPRRASRRCSSYEARLGSEKFGKEVHAYSVAFSGKEIQSVRAYATKVIFNSVSQLERFRSELNDMPLGLPVNPGISHSQYNLAEPARAGSSLGACGRTSSKPCST